MAAKYKQSSTGNPHTHNTHNHVMLNNCSSTGTMHLKEIVVKSKLGLVPTAANQYRQHRKQDPMSLLRQKVSGYLTDFRQITDPDSIGLKLDARIVPYSSGIVIRMEYNTKGGEEFLDPQNTVEDAVKCLGVDFDQYLADFKKNTSKLKSTYVFRKGNILYLIKDNLSQDWTISDVAEDVTIINAVVKSKVNRLKV